jgi:poly(3-hydroxybutyrate) depolymerase
MRFVSSLSVIALLAGCGVGEIELLYPAQGGGEISVPAEPVIGPIVETGSAPDAGTVQQSSPPDTGSVTRPDAGAPRPMEPTGPFVSGRSTGCGKPAPAGTSSTQTALKELEVPGVTDPVYLPGGKLFINKNLPRSGKWDWQTRAYGIRLPKNYDPSKAYPVVMGGGGCGGSIEGFASGPNTGYSPGDDLGLAIQVGLAYLGGCFDDGGPGIDNRTDTPEVPYVRSVLDEIEANYCVDKSLVFLVGTSSGAWEANTTGCALADRVRSIGTVAGGLRNHRPACAGPQAAFIIVDTGDNANPIGPIVPPAGHLDSGGSAPARDELLKRNKCVPEGFVFSYESVNGNAPSAQWDPAFPTCVKYTGCPEAYPVVWCALAGGHQNDREGTISYKTGMWTFFSRLPAR